MSHSRKHGQEVSESIDSNPLVCPDCAQRFPPQRLECRNCDITAVERDGVVSFQPKRDESLEHLSDPEIDEFTRALPSQSIRDAADEILDGNEQRTEILAELFDVQRELWQPLVEEHVTGRCLDLNAGYGRRSMVLAELADSVCAVDRSLSKLRIAAERDDYASSDRVFPVHTTDERIPFPDGWFDTVFADLTGSTDVPSKIDRLEDHLTEEGSLLFLADGWSRNGGVTDLLGLDRSGSIEGGDLLPGTAAGYRSLARSVGFDDISVYALFPTASRPLYAFDIECDQAIPMIFESYSNEQGFVGDCVKEIMELLNKSGLLKKCYPSFLVVCSNDPKPSPFDFSNPLVVSGRTRSVVLEMGADGVDDIYKIPNRNGHEPFTSRENIITSMLCSKESDIKDTIAEGETIDSKLGPTRRVKPADGKPLDEETGRDAKSLERVLDIGFDWLIEFQNAFGTELTEKSPTEVRDDLQFEPANLDGPRVENSVKTFTTPAHGDFMSSNIYYDGEEITSIIDWEYGTAAASPVVDAGHLLLNTVDWIGGDFTENVRTVLCGRNEYAERARACVRRYCDAVGLPYRTFEVYLPAAYLHQLTIDWEFDAVSTYMTRSEEQIRRVQILFEEVDDMTISD